MKSQKKFLNMFFFGILLLVVPLSSFAQNVVNNGDGIVINSGAHLVIGGSYINETATQNGFVDNDGNMVVFGDFENNASNLVFANIEAVPDGKTWLPSASNQSILGSASTQFENLRVSGGKKTLDNSHAYVSGVFTIESVFDLNSNVLELENGTATAMVYNSGYLFAETTPIPGLGILRWNIEAITGNFDVPFGSGNSSFNDLNLVLNISQVSSGNGFVDFSTYPTSSENNPLPDPATSLDPFKPDVTIDRFWILDAQYITKPEAQITFSYTDADFNPIQESSLLAIRYNENSVSWDDRAPDGAVNPSSNTLTTSTVLPSDFYKNWTLTGTIPEDFIYIPNSFTPNGDGSNDYFYPVIGNSEDVQGYYFTVFDRWGTQLFTSEESQAGWDGYFKGVECPQDIYVYVFEYYSALGTPKQVMGRITLFR
jgi:gliding motility-associated-like protein